MGHQFQFGGRRPGQGPQVEEPLTRVWPGSLPDRPIPQTGTRATSVTPSPESQRKDRGRTSE